MSSLREPDIHPPVIDVQGLHFSYNGDPVLSDVNLKVHQGDYMAILGPNGGGKTTLLKLMLGLLAPNQGRVELFGQPVSRVLHRVGYVPQYAEARRNFPINVEQVVELGLGSKRARGFGSARKNRDKVMTALERVTMEFTAKRRFDNLSGGQRQRVLVARALAAEPELLVFDEPTANVDPQGKTCLFELLAQLGQEITIVVVSHDLVLASAGINRVAAVNRTLIANNRPELSPEMVALLYGEHDRTCPMGNTMNGVPILLGHKCTGPDCASHGAPGCSNCGHPHDHHTGHLGHDGGHEHV